MSPALMALPFLAGAAAVSSAGRNCPGAVRFSPPPPGGSDLLQEGSDLLQGGSGLLHEGSNLLHGNGFVAATKRFVSRSRPPKRAKQTPPRPRTTQRPRKLPSPSVGEAAMNAAPGGRGISPGQPRKTGG